MFSTLKTAALSAIVALGALAAIPATAQADGFYLGFGGGHGPRAGVVVGGGDYDGDRWRRQARGCQPWEAVAKARRMGVRNAHVVDVSRRTIEVAGRARGHRVELTFGRQGNCPLYR